MNPYDDGNEVAADTGAGLVEEATDGKHIIVGVGDFWGSGQNPSRLPGTPMNAYLRMGVASPLAGSTDVARGEDLASLVQGFADDTRARGDGTESVKSPPESTTTEAARRTASILLHNKGGWRDHSDGNRITTTRGDKVEVIQGNYKLVVLGRQSPAAVTAARQQIATLTPARQGQLQGLLQQADGARKALLGSAGGMDISGGENDLAGDAYFASEPESPQNTADPNVSRHQIADLEAAGTPGNLAQREDLTVDYRWTQDTHGTWAWTMTTTVGMPPQVHGAGKYRVINKAFVDYQKDQYGYYGDGPDPEGGTLDSRLSKMKATTFAQNMDTTVDVSGENHTQLSGGTVLNQADVQSIQTTQLTALLNEVDFTATIGLAQFAAIDTVVQLGVMVSNLWAGITADAKLAHLDVHIGPHMDIHVGPHIDTRNGIHTDFHASLHTDMHIGTHFDLDSGANVEFHLRGGVLEASIPAASTTATTPGGTTEVRATPDQHVGAAPNTEIGARHALGQ
jgi:hypothetical protein